MVTLDVGGILIAGLLFAGLLWAIYNWTHSHVGPSK